MLCIYIFTLAEVKLCMKSKFDIIKLLPKSARKQDTIQLRYRLRQSGPLGFLFNLTFNLNAHKFCISLFSVEMSGLFSLKNFDYQKYVFLLKYILQIRKKKVLFTMKVWIYLQP